MDRHTDNKPTDTARSADESTRDIKREFDELVRTHGAVVNKVCYFYAVDSADFQDLRQEALLNIWRGLEKFAGKSAIGTWVYRVTLNSCVSYFRKHKRGASSSEPIENHPEIIAEDDEKAALVRELYSLINKLDGIDKAVILMWLDGNDYQTIGDVVGLARATVGTRVHRIKEKLIGLSNN